MQRIIVTFLLLTTCIIHATPPPLQNEDGSLTKKAWAHYVPWNHPVDIGFAACDYYCIPTLRPQATNILSYKKEIEQAQQSGLDGFFVNVVLNQGGIAYSSYLADMLTAAEGTDFYVAACLDGGVDPQVKIDRIEQIVNSCGQHPNYPKIDGKPVFATFLYKSYTPAQWQTVINGLNSRGIQIYLIANFEPLFNAFDQAYISSYNGCFDMIYMFSHYGVNGDNERVTSCKFALAAAVNNAEYMACIWPGYSGGWYIGSNDFYQPFREFDQMLDCYEALQYAGAKWIQLTSWNDHRETTLMPTVFDSASQEINKYLIGRWKNGFAEAQNGKVFFAYHREKIPGSMLRFETLILPGNITSENFQIECKLYDTAGNLVATQTKSTTVNKEQQFSRFEMIFNTNFSTGIPNGLVPHVTVNGVTATLPPIFFRNGWTENQFIIKAPFDKFTESATSAPSLTVTQTNNELNATVSLAGLNDPQDKVVHAQLWRNDRPIGPMKVNAPTNPIAYMLLNLKAVAEVRGEFNNTVILSSARKFKYPGYSWTSNTFYSNPCPVYYPLKFEISASADALFKFRFYGNSVYYNLTLQELLQKRYVDIGGSTPVITLMLSDCDNAINEHEELNFTSGTLYHKLWTRPQLENDTFYVRFETEKGKIFYSNITTPFLPSANFLSERIYVTNRTLEYYTGASGKPGRTGYFDTPADPQQVVLASIHPACFRSAKWDFDNGNIDSLGERDIFDSYRNINSIMGCIVDRSSGGKCLQLDGQTQIRLRQRANPMTGCTIKFDIKPDSGRTNDQVILGNSGFASRFLINLRVDGKLEVSRKHLEGTDPSDTLVSPVSLQDNVWSTVWIAFNERYINVYINDVHVVGNYVTQLHRYGNTTSHLGATTNGFKGKLDNIIFYSRPVHP